MVCLKIGYSRIQRFRNSLAILGCTLKSVSHFQTQYNMLLYVLSYSTPLYLHYPHYICINLYHIHSHLEVMVKEGDDLRQDQLGILGFRGIRQDRWSWNVLKIGFQMSSRTEEFIFFHLFSRIQLLHTSRHGMASCLGCWTPRLVLQLIILMDSILKRYGAWVCLIVSEYGPPNGYLGKMMTNQ